MNCFDIKDLMPKSMLTDPDLAETLGRAMGNIYGTTKEAARILEEFIKRHADLKRDNDELKEANDSLRTRLKKAEKYLHKDHYYFSWRDHWLKTGEDIGEPSKK